MGHSQNNPIVYFLIVSDEGLTLLEMLVVLTMIALMAAVMLPRFNTDSGPIDMMKHVHLAEESLERVRSVAIRENRNVVFIINVQEKFWGVEGGEQYNLPDSIDLGLTYAKNQETNTEQGEIIFFPDGSSTGGQLVIRSDKLTFIIKIDWLTGHVRVIKNA